MQLFDSKKSVRVLFRDQDTVLLVKQDHKGKDSLFLPGGRKKLWETDQQAIKRELKEELGLTANYIKSTVFRFLSKDKETVIRADLTEVLYICDILPQRNIIRIEGNLETKDVYFMKITEAINSKEYYDNYIPNILRSLLKDQQARI